MNSVCCTTQWFPWTLLHPDKIFEKYAIVILNTPIFWKSEFLLPFWSKASIRVLVDGGANRWIKWIRDNKICNYDLPSFVTGDMDSINKEILANFRSDKNVDVVYTSDQNETDFTKSVREIKSYASKHNIQIKNIVTVVGTSGRLDQIMANIETLFHCHEFAPEYKVLLLGGDSLSWLMQAGKHKIYIPEELRKQWCALIPIGKKCEKISTTGLKWNLDNQSLHFGDMVSTSNTYSDEDTVSIHTSDTFLWSMGLDNIPTDSEDNL